MWHHKFWIQPYLSNRVAFLHDKKDKTKIKIFWAEPFSFIWTNLTLQSLDTPHLIKIAFAMTNEKIIWAVCVGAVQFIQAISTTLHTMTHCIHWETSSSKQQIWLKCTAIEWLIGTDIGLAITWPRFISIQAISFLMLYSFNWPNLIARLPPFLNILGNIFITVLC